MELDNQLKDTLKMLPKYQRKICQDCEYILICAGECNKTLKGDKYEQSLCNNKQR